MADVARVNELLTIVASDAALRQRLADAGPAEREAIVAELGFSDVTPADVAAYTAKHAPHADGELDEDQLEIVAGGGTTIDIATATTVNSSGAFIVF